MDTKKPVDIKGSDKEVISSSIGGRPRLRLSAIPLKVVGLAAIVILALVLVYVFVIANKPVFAVNGKVYRERQVKHLAAYETERRAIPYKLAAKDVYNAVKQQAAGQAAHLEPSATQRELGSAGSNISKADRAKYKDWFDLVGYNAGVNEMVNSSKNSVVPYNYQGYSYVFWFGNAVQPFYHDPSPEFGNNDAYQKDQAYAKQKADYYHDQLQNHKMTADQVLAAVKKDAKLADLNDVRMNASTKFGYDQHNLWSDQVQYPDVARYISAQVKPGVGDVQTGTIDDTPAPLPTTKRVTAYYYFVQINRARLPDMAQQYEDALKNLKAKYYGA